MTEAARPIRPMVAGNWKMNGLMADLAEALRVRDAISAPGAALGADVLICPPATLLLALAEAASGSKLLVGAQDCAVPASGPHTGDLSAEMLRDAGAVATIVGHSERRAAHSELDGIVRCKAEAAHRAGLAAIVCVGETAGERQSELTLEVVGRQLSGSLPDTATAANTIVAYEPIWAIGTGLTPTPADVAEAHSAMREILKDRFGAEGAGMRLLYGGSVKPDNAAEIGAVDDVDGALVGGASLKSNDFLAIIAAYKN